MTNEQYLSELLPKLADRIAYEWRVQSFNKDKTKAQCTAYIDARDAMEVLDKYCKYGWTSDYEEICGFLFCSIGITMPDGSLLWRFDAGARIEDNQQDQMYEQAGKSAASDAFKRAAVQWGVGRFLYSLDQVWLPSNGRQVVDDKGAVVYNLTEYITNHRGRTHSKPATTPPAQASNELPALDDAKFQAMLKFLDEGKVKDVETAIKKYKLNLSQKAVLTARINQVKTQATTAATK